MEPTIYKRPHIYKSNVYKRYGMNRGGIGVYKLPYGSQEFEEDENVNTSLGHEIPLDRAGFDVSLIELNELPRMATPNDSCGFDVSLVSSNEVTRMATPNDSCGFDVSLVSIVELT